MCVFFFSGGGDLIILTHIRHIHIHFVLNCGGIIEDKQQVNRSAEH